MISQSSRERQVVERSKAKEQNRILRDVKITKHFFEALRENESLPLKATPVETLQVNVGKLCNQRCVHCHVNAGPDREELMRDDVLDRTLDIFEKNPIHTIDITGGAPELHPRFREIIHRAALPGRRVIHRCNFTAIMTKPHQDIPELLAEHKVEIVGSLPCYTKENTDRQRGAGVFDTSIKSIRRLNNLGYGKEGTGLILNLVYNPNGAFLPPDESNLEAEYKKRLQDRYGIVFNSLFAMTNLPIGRFLDFLLTEEMLEEYMELLVSTFNPKTIEPLMCRSMVSISWDGYLYDCDFNQILDLRVDGNAPQTVFDWDTALLEKRAIVIGEHCFGCTAGSGSSCGGQTG